MKRYARSCGRKFQTIKQLSRPPDTACFIVGENVTHETLSVWPRKVLHRVTPGGKVAQGGRAAGRCTVPARDPRTPCCAWFHYLGCLVAGPVWGKPTHVRLPCLAASAVQVRVCVCACQLFLFSAATRTRTRNGRT